MNSNSKVFHSSREVFKAYIPDYKERSAETPISADEWNDHDFNAKLIAHKIVDEIIKDLKKIK